MLINVSSLAPKDSMQVNFNNVSVDVPGGNATAVVDVDGTLTYDGKEAYTFNGEVSAVLSLNCDLCLKSFQSKITFTIEEVFCNDTDSEKEFWDFSDKTIDLKPAVVADILLNMPMRAVCSDDCKGLCPKCGHNLNEGDCGCDRGYRNPQFEKLMTLFNDKEV
jgi:uncharacterized protein